MSTETGYTRPFLMRVFDVIVCLASIVALGVIIFALTGCNGDSKSEPSFEPFVHLVTEGKYEITLHPLEGDCKEMTFEFEIYKGIIYDAPSNPHPELRASLIGEDLSMLIDCNGQRRILNGYLLAQNLDNGDSGGQISGDWSTPNGACFGYATGKRIE